ncbi:MAG: HAD family phosphatase [Mogibacterium sp.]|nr:HAD family phosphatase [Mogibacterium sp.]MBQ6501756.1 HAD family phosphatase [Mogibacterium sp.]
MMRFSNEIKGVIFDVDGVLLDSLEIWTDLGARYLISIGKSPEEGLADILFSMSMEQGAEYLKENYDIDRSAEDIAAGLRNMMRDFYFYEVQAKPGADRLLRAISDAGISITAATSSPREHIERALERNGLLGYIRRMFTNSEVGRSKHFPDIYNAAAAEMRTAPEETVVFEDSLYALKTAAAAGYHTIGVSDCKGEPDQDGLREAAEVYINELCEAVGLF